MFLPDVNLWVAMSFETHVHHAPAKAWFESNSELCFFCRMTQQGFLRLATNPKVFADETLTTSKAWEAHDNLLADRRITFADEPAGVDATWRSLTRDENVHAKTLERLRFSPRFAICGGFEIVSFDKDFRRFNGLRCAILLGFFTAS